MKKSIFIAAALAMLMPACQQMEEVESQGKSKKLSFNVGFEIDKEPVSRSSISDYISTLQVFDYKDGELANKITQTSQEADFGVLSLDAEYGIHEYIFVGHNSSVCDYDYSKSELSFDKVLDTFTATQTLTVNYNTNEDQNIELTRQVAGLKLVMLDAIPENAASIELTVDGYAETLNPLSGTGVSSVKHTRGWEYSSSNIGKTGTSYTLYTFLPSDPHTVNITFRLTDTEGKDIVNYTLEDISVEKNRMTVISGYLLSTELSSSIEINGEWGEDIEVNL